VTTSAHRKVVTILFCDVVGSTALGESVDPEALQGVLAGYFERMKAIVESHGGTVEKFIGDAVMAVFGVPVAHEDDALRACRAAVEMRDALPELGVEGRIGVNTGEVLTGTEERLATGDAVNVAARLEQAAEPGEVLIGAETLGLVGAAVEIGEERLPELKGKSEPVSAWPLLAVREVVERSHGSRFVGRERELQQLVDAWDRALADSACELVTVVGDPGVGKSRLVAEALARIDARVVRGRCLPYGEGITYWPVVEVLKQLDARPSDPAAAEAIAALVGESDTRTSAEEIAWAFRKLLEEQAPLVVCLDDIQWGEETLLDLVEHVALLSTEASILLVCMARPELSERRPQWPIALRLDPLPDKDADALLPERLPAELRERIASAAGGNPLFLTEMAAMAGETEAGLVVPPNLKALLVARLDGLEPSERSVLECGAIEGEVFHRGAVQVLADREQVTPLLASLVRKDLIQRERPLLTGQDAFRFRHLLIRDAAYDALPKVARAELHDRFSGWLERHGDSLVELDEILGHHLERAARFKAELGTPDPDLAERAANHLAAAGRRGLLRDDHDAAASLLERALELRRPTRLDVVLELDLAEALELSDRPRAAEIADAAADRAGAGGDNAGELLARAAAAFHRAWFVPDPDVDELERLASGALVLLEERQDHAALVHAWGILGYGVANFRGRWDDWAHAGREALRHARAAGQPAGSFYIALAIASGTTPAGEALEAVETLLPAISYPGLDMMRAYLLAMLGRFDEAVALAEDSRRRIFELRGTNWVDWVPAKIAAYRGDHEAAVGYLRPLCTLLRDRDERFYLSTEAADLGRELCALREYDEAEQWAELARGLGVRQSVLGEAGRRQVMALVHASRGEHAQAELLARQAVAIIEGADGLNYQGDAWCDLAEVLERAGRRDEATATLEQALERYERKGNVPLAGRVRERLAEVQRA
jgi:class 3 adenylate cyclase/tetratricopeptide (TPR) repeat protein